MAINKNSEYIINFVKNRKQNLISVFDNKCCICGFNSYPEALDFHHVNPEEKEFPLSSNVMKSLEKQLKEAKKCILVCANCHRGIHAGYIEIPKNYKLYSNMSITFYESDEENKNAYVLLTLPLKGDLEKGFDNVKYMYLYNSKENPINDNSIRVTLDNNNNS